ncbi:replication endonuclease [Salinisphaera sp. LB1]|uniref:replication endonuclease n=1 Tax=Salinisphaera sp. LB1 TaxID=2183911 RepID=UPI000D706AB1|nr:replication endonuclease [Salinisphaera sp. LB1]AWN16619.1 Putative replication protein [Salinisphaera sp. LB1]
MSVIEYVSGLSAREIPADGRIWLRKQLDSQPVPVANALAEQHRRTYHAERDQGRPNPMRPANIQLREFVEASQGLLPPSATGDDIRAFAKRRSHECEQSMRRVNGDEMATYAAGHGVVSRFGLVPPTPNRNRTLFGCIERMRDEGWWRNQLHKIHGRKHEQQARSFGLVHKRAGLYISEYGFQRYIGRQESNARALNDTMAVCETGEEFSLAEIADKGLSNPSIRRNEMMGRINGIERYAEARGDVALFASITTPPELHAVHSKSLEPGDGQHVTPREGQEWLMAQWKKFRAKLKRASINAYGLRVAEPHHDGTPHWHVLLFVDPAQADLLRRMLTVYFVAGSTDRARQERACDIQAIDPQRGSATGYIAKYISKGMDGHGLDYAATLDSDGQQVGLETDPKDAAQRVRAWASQWGIRQFQFMGTPAIGPWRELRRIRNEIEGNPKAEALRKAADEGDYARYMELMGGAAVKASARPAHVRYAADTECGRYGETKQRAYLDAFGVTYTTRPVRWIIEYQPSGESRNGDNAEQFGRNVTGSGATGIRAEPVTGNLKRDFLNEFQRAALAQRRSREHLDSWK